MHLFVSARALLRPFLAVLVATAGVAAAGAQAASTVVISEIYGGGGNAGATYTNDFIELFNPTSAPQSLSQYSVQYASSTGTSYQVAPLPSVTLQPGQFFLLQAAAGAGGTTSLPSPDAISSLSLSATTGKIALVNNTTALSGTAGCPTMDASLLDFVGFGSGANCFLGTGSTPTLSNTTAAIRTNLCVNAKNNSSEFTAQPALPHNTASTPQPCTGAGAAITATAQATPASVFAGSQTLLTVSVNPATNPPSTNLQVTANLSAIGGYSSQPFFDDGSHGDVTAGDNVYSYATSPSTNGSYTLPVSVQDAQLRTATATVSLTVQTPPTVVSIRAIQAAKPSPYAGQTVTTSGIVVGVRASGIYLEARDADNNPTTPEGLYIYTGSSAKPSYIAVGAEIQVSGKVANYPPTSPTPDTEIDGPQTFTFLSANNPLPAAIKITAAQDNPSGSVYQFAKYEGMRVAIDSLTSTSGTGASLNEQTETQTSNGQFYGVVTGIARPFREPGISVTDIVYGSIPSGVPVWDSNPELLLVDSRSLGGPAVNLTSNTTVTGLSGVMDFSSGAPSILLDATDHPGISSGPGPRALPLKAANEFTVASFNMERFYNDQVDADNPGSSVVVVTPEAYQRRLNKASLAIRTILNNPDLIGAQEIENLNVLNDLANKINADTTASGQANPQYQAYLFLANDGTGINTGVLAKGATVTALKAEQIGLNATFTNARAIRRS